MGGGSSKREEESARAQYLFIKALIKKQNLLVFQINNLKIRHMYARLNPNYKVLKDLLPFRKALKSSMEKTKRTMSKVRNRDCKTHALISSEEITQISQNLSKTEQVSRVLAEDIKERLLKINQLTSKLLDLKKTLQKKKKVFQSNKKKIQNLGIVADLVYGKRKTSEFFEGFKVKSEKEISRFDSISTTGSSRHFKNVSSIPMDFNQSEDEFCDTLNQSVIVSPSLRSKKLKRFKSFVIFPERTLFLRSKRILKDDLETTIFTMKTQMFKRYSRVASQSFYLENLVFALENDPQKYLMQLGQEILVREHELDVEVCKKEYLGSIIDPEKEDQECNENKFPIVVQ